MLRVRHTSVSGLQDGLLSRTENDPLITIDRAAQVPVDVRLESVVRFTTADRD